MLEKIDPHSGLTEQELECHKSLMEAYSAWLELPIQHPGDMQEFVDAIHMIQNLLAFRTARRNYPKYWIDHSKCKK